MTLDEISKTQVENIVDGSYRMLDQDLLDDVGNEFVISETLLGHGSYGNVFLATDKNFNEYAAKLCLIEDGTGIPNILETSIMSSFVHPTLNKAICICVNPDKLYIIQNKATSDLAKYTNKNKQNNRPTLEELKRWAFAIADAISVLHNKDIIHCDIKASNILLFSDGNVKLTDFTLATKKITPKDMFNHNVCTCTHRPLECLKKEYWNESLDVWSLGCTLYEIAYGELLFPYQGDFRKTKRMNQSDFKKELRNRCILAISYWNNSVDKDVQFIKPELCGEFHNPEMAEFNNLIMSMLEVDPNKRPTITKVLNHSFFKDCVKNSCLNIRRPLNVLRSAEEARVMRYLELYTNDKYIKKLAYEMYCQCNNISFSEKIVVATCVWITEKIINFDPPEIPDISLHDILSCEREICHNLKFRLCI